MSANDLSWTSPTRGQVEAVILVHAAGRDGCSMEALTDRLGLAASQRDAVQKAATEVMLKYGWFEAMKWGFRPTQQGLEAVAAASRITKG